MNKDKGIYIVTDSDKKAIADQSQLIKGIFKSPHDLKLNPQPTSPEPKKVER
jgi:hypothetical protein